MKDTSRKVDPLIGGSLKNSEIRYRRLFETAQDGILILDASTGMIEDVNPYLIKMLGYSREEFLKKRLWEVGAFKDIEASKDAFEVLQEKEYIRYEDLPLKTKDGRLIQVEFVSSVYLVSDEKVIQCDIRDITEHRRLVAALQDNEKTYRDLINQSPDGYFILELSGNILTVNKAMCKELEFSEEEFLAMHIWDIIPEQFLDQYRERLTKILAGKNLKDAAEYEIRGKNGKIHYVEVLSAPRYSGGEVIGFQGIARDVSARKRAEAALAESEERFRAWTENSSDLITVVVLDGTIQYESPSIEHLLGYKPEELIGTNAFDLMHPDDHQRVMELFAQNTQQAGNATSAEFRLRHRDGSWRQFEGLGKSYLNEQGQMTGLINSRDITERKQAEAAAREGQQRFSQVWEATSDAMALSDPDGIVLEANPAYLDLYGYKLEQVVGRSFAIIFPEEIQAQAVEQYKTVFASEVIPATFESTIRRADGSERVVESSVSFLTATGQRIAMLSTIRDITDRKRAEEKIQRQLEHLTALGEIDQAISSSSDLRFTLGAVLAQVITQLGVDAADILLFHPDSHLLTFSTGRGFRTKAFERAHSLRLGEGYAGSAALKRAVVHIPDLAARDDNPRIASALKGEAFTSYYGVPLIAKGKIKGVLEIFQRSPLNPDRDWLDFLHTLAEQAAIAIDNLTLFDDLQRSNSELMLAYETTLEGWSHALDLRDKETEGHTQRVTEMTVKLARAFGLSEAELVNVRRGGLLHDIGKMGVPDHILLKPGQLTDDEWQQMRMHPIYAYDLLSHIAYLHKALDIPYCHHEKWDGSGYPRGLKGDQIPIAARIFAVVDVWDALISERPYRAAWTEEKAREHLRASVGTHFDPQVVDAFMQFLN
ncbi:MAG: PAS domain S-box protein [Anaerolineaceae bacterium]|nr:MAG: PAS domain S-box protein [Anaerolineaceae bacterium]